jgi:hypothetical protein
MPKIFARRNRPKILALICSLLWNGLVLAFLLPPLWVLGSYYFRTFKKHNMQYGVELTSNNMVYV